MGEEKDPEEERPKKKEERRKKKEERRKTIKKVKQKSSTMIKQVHVHVAAQAKVAVGILLLLKCCAVFGGNPTGFAPKQTTTRRRLVFNSWFTNDRWGRHVG